MRLQGKIALVTGSARGIGFAVAKALAAEGAVPVIADINEAGAREALAKLDRPDGLALGVDVAEQASVGAMVARSSPATAGSTSSSTTPASGAIPLSSTSRSRSGTAPSGSTSPARSS